MAKANATAAPRWSPYGHELYRKALIRKRQRNIILAVIGLAVLYFLYGLVTATDEATVDQNRVTVDTDKPQKPTRVGVTPGRASFADSVGDAPATAPHPLQKPPPEPALAFVMSVVKASTPVLIAYYLLSRINTVPRGKLAEVNFGVFKGAMPYEMVTAHARERVFNYQEAHESVFGKEREDFIFGKYLHRPPAEIRRLLGEKVPKPTARVTKVVAKGGAGKASA